MQRRQNGTYVIYSLGLCGDSAAAFWISGSDLMDFFFFFRKSSKFSIIIVKSTKNKCMNELFLVLLSNQSFNSTYIL